MLQKYREEIDKIDSELIKLFASRFEVVKQIWEYKKLNNIQPLDESRWQQVLESKKKLAKEFWLDEEFIVDIWNRIHTEALKIEN